MSKSSGVPSLGDAADDMKAADRADKTKKILAEADRRDDAATARDLASEEREQAADLKAFLDTSGHYPGQGERRSAAIDRNHSKSDRESSADDRAQLAEASGADDEPETP